VNLRITKIQRTSLGSRGDTLEVDVHSWIHQLIPAGTMTAHAYLQKLSASILHLQEAKAPKVLPPDFDELEWTRWGEWFSKYRG